MIIFLILFGAFAGTMTEKTLNYGSLKQCVREGNQVALCEKFTREVYKGDHQADQYKN